MWCNWLRCLSISAIQSVSLQFDKLFGVRTMFCNLRSFCLFRTTLISVAALYCFIISGYAKASDHNVYWFLCRNLHTVCVWWLKVQSSGTPSDVHLNGWLTQITHFLVTVSFVLNRVSYLITDCIFLEFLILFVSREELHDRNKN